LRGEPVRPARDTASRPSTILLKGPVSDRPSSPSSCRVFQGVPSPASRAAGHMRHAVGHGDARAAQAQRGAELQWRGGAAVGAERASVATRCKLGRSATPARPGRAAASWLPEPPVSTRRAEPFHTVPRASASSTWPSAGAFAPPASQCVPVQTAPAPSAGRPAAPADGPAPGRALGAGGQAGGCAVPRLSLALARRQGHDQRAVPLAGGVAREARFGRQGAGIHAGLGQPLGQGCRARRRSV
jgi:hypothetical protein